MLKSIKIVTLLAAVIGFSAMAHAQYVDTPFGQMDASAYYNQLTWSQPDAVQNYVNSQIDTLNTALKVDLEVSFDAGLVMAGGSIADAAAAGALGLDVLGESATEVGIHTIVDKIAEYTIDPLTDFLHDQANDYFLDQAVQSVIDNTPINDYPDDAGNAAAEV
jgi:hypothetical protein